MAPVAEVETAAKTPYEEATEAAEAIAAVIREYRHVHSTEDTLPARVAAMLLAAEVDHERVDDDDPAALVAGRVIVAVTTAGGVRAMGRQLIPYAAREGVDALVVVTTRARHVMLPPDVDGTPVVVVWLSPRLLAAEQ